MDKSLLDWALLYAHQGWHVFPLAQGSKKPLGGSRGLLDATRDEQQIEAWWKQHPNANIGLNCGKSGIVVLDVDTSNGKVGAQSLLDLIGEDFSFLYTRQSKTWSGGSHYFYVGNAATTAGLLAKNLDTRGDGGYVVLPPSRVTESGQTGIYTWIANNEEQPGKTLPCAPFPDIFRSQAKSNSSVREVERIAKGKRNSELVRVAGLYRRIGMSTSTIAAALQVDNQQRCDPPLPQREVDQIAKSIGRYEPAQSTEVSTKSAFANREFEFIDLNTYQSKAPQFIGMGILKNALTILDGDGGIGKSTLIRSVIADLTRGRALPCGTQSAPMNVLIIAHEDSVDIIKESLRLHDADLDRIKFTKVVRTEDGNKRSFILPQDVAIIGTAIEEHKVEFVYIDALVSHLDPSLSANLPQDVRTALTPLNETGISKNAAIVGTKHWKKGASSASDRGAGTKEFRNVARSALTVGLHPSAPDLRVVAPNKQLLGAPKSHAFRIIPHEVVFDDGNIQELGKIEWTGPVNIIADDLTMATAQSAEERSERDEAKELIFEFLSDGPKLATALFEHVEAAGIASRRTIERARRDLSQTFQIERSGGGNAGPVYWALRADRQNTGRSPLSDGGDLPEDVEINKVVCAQEADEPTENTPPPSPLRELPLPTSRGMFPPDGNDEAEEQARKVKWI